MQLAPQSLSHGGEQLSGAVTSLRRSLRHSSLRTASGIRKSKNYTTRMVKRKSLVPLSHGRGPSSASHPGKSGPATSIASTSTAHTAKKQTRSPLGKKHRLSDHCCTSMTISRPRARIILSQAHQVIALRTDWLGRKLSVMDVILDSRSPTVDFDEDALIEATRQPTCPLHCQYDSADKPSYATYCADQAPHWDDMRTLERITNRFPNSDERSTASWSPSLDKQRAGV